MRRSLFVATCLATIFSGRIYAASFDCNRASTPTEHMICGSRELSTLDDEMMDFYKRARASLSSDQEKTALLQSQRNWVRQRNAQCHDIQCLMTTYQNRVEDLELYGAEPDVKAMLVQENKLDDFCRGGSGDEQKTQDSCDQRDALFTKIEARGWCWGPDDAAEVDKSWGQCTAIEHKTVAPEPSAKVTPVQPLQPVPLLTPKQAPIPTLVEGNEPAISKLNKLSCAALLDNNNNREFMYPATKVSHDAYDSSGSEYFRQTVFGINWSDWNKRAFEAFLHLYYACMPPSSRPWEHSEPENMAEESAASGFLSERQELTRDWVISFEEMTQQASTAQDDLPKAKHEMLISPFPPASRGAGGINVDAVDNATSVQWNQWWTGLSLIKAEVETLSAQRL